MKVYNIKGLKLLATTLLCFSISTFTFGIVNPSAKLDGAVSHANLKLATQAEIASHTKLFLYCDTGGGTTGQQTCKILLHAICGVYGLTTNTAAYSKCTLAFTHYTSSNCTSGNCGTSSSVQTGTTGTTAAVPNAVALASGANSYAIAAATGSSQALNTAIIGTGGSATTAFGPTYVADPAVCFASNAAPDIQTDNILAGSVSWADATDTVFAELHGSNANAVVGFEVSQYSGTITDRETTLGKSDAFVATYTLTLDAHTTAGHGGSCTAAG